MQENIIIKNFENFNYDNHTLDRPALIGCSGGFGHIAAINAIIDYLVCFSGYLKLKDFPLYELSQQKKTILDLQSAQIKIGSLLLHQKLGSIDISQPLKSILSSLNIPIIPDYESLISEINNLETQAKKLRRYVDMLLDVLPSGSASAATWNVLQRQDKTEDLTKLVTFQESNDNQNYSVVKEYFLNLFLKKLNQGKPYTSVISTQAISLPGLCDAIIEYNNIISNSYPKEVYTIDLGDAEENNMQTSKKIPLLQIHQFLTDLPTEGAVHFFKTLQNLNANQRKIMTLYGLGFEENIVKRFNLQSPPFANIFNIRPENNPIVRRGFYKEELKTIARSDIPQTLTIQLKDNEEKKYIIPENEKIAAIMLGSQAGDDTIEYVKEILAHDSYKKIFVFGATKPNIAKKLNEIIATNPDAAKRIIPLENQDDNYIAPIMARSNLVIKRGGGLSVMEEMAIPHVPQQTILIHTKDSEDNELTSGIIWEDKNTDKLMNYCNDKGIFIMRTSPKKFPTQLALIEKDVGAYTIKPSTDRFELESKRNTTQVSHQSEKRNVRGKRRHERHKTLLNSFIENTRENKEESTEDSETIKNYFTNS